MRHTVIRKIRCGMVKRRLAACVSALSPGARNAPGDKPLQKFRCDRAASLSMDTRYFRWSLGEYAEATKIMELGMDQTL
jgi:hypothetical protein